MHPKQYKITNYYITFVRRLHYTNPIRKLGRLSKSFFSSRKRIKSLKLSTSPTRRDRTNITPPVENPSVATLPHHEKVAHLRGAPFRPCLHCRAPRFPWPVGNCERVEPNWDDTRLEYRKRSGGCLVHKLTVDYINRAQSCCTGAPASHQKILRTVVNRRL